MESRPLSGLRPLKLSRSVPVDDSVISISTHKKGYLAVCLKGLLVFTEDFQLRFKFDYSAQIDSTSILRALISDTIIAFLCTQQGSLCLRFLSLESYSFLETQVVMKMIFDLSLAANLLAIFRPHGVEIHYLPSSPVLTITNVMVARVHFEDSLISRVAASENFLVFRPESDFLSLLYCYVYENGGSYFSVLFYMLTEIDSGYVDKNNFCIRGGVAQYEASPDLVLYAVLSSEGSMYLFERDSHALLFVDNASIRALSGLRRFSFFEDGSQLIIFRKDALSLHDINHDFICRQSFAAQSSPGPSFVVGEKFFATSKSDISFYER